MLQAPANREALSADQSLGQAGARWRELRLGARLNTPSASPTTGARRKKVLVNVDLMTDSLSMTSLLHKTFPHKTPFFSSFRINAFSFVL